MKKQILSFVLCILFVISTFYACQQTSDTKSDSDFGSNETVKQPATDNIPEPDTSDATFVKWETGKVSISGNGATEKDNTVTITNGGTYVISGTVSNGRIIVNAPKNDVCLVLDNANITCLYSSPLYIYKCEKASIYVTAETENPLSDGTDYRFDDGLSSEEDSEPNACLYSKSDLIITGSGQLNINANYNNGITGKDTLQIASALISVKSANHGINGKDSLTIQNSQISVSSGGDALRSTNDSDTSAGFISITDSKLELTAGEDGIQAETSITVHGGQCSINAGGGSNQKISSDASAKGIKAGTDIQIDSGKYSLDCNDDAIHANGNVTISGGTYTVLSGDDGIHANQNVSISDGTVTVNKSYEGIEGAVITISGGTIKILSDDDGINASGGSSDQSQSLRAPGPFGGSSSDCSICISGGIIYIDASGDGIDSNGDLNISGGEVYISGSTGNGDSAVDYDGNAIITGGIVIAAGSSGMAQNFSNSSTQGCILLNYSSFSNAEICLFDEAGTELLRYTPPKSYNSILISCPDLVKDGSYTVTACGQTKSVTLSSLIYGDQNGMNGPNSSGGNMGNLPFPGMGRNDMPDNPQNRNDRPEISGGFNV